MRKLQKRVCSFMTAALVSMSSLSGVMQINTYAAEANKDAVRIEGGVDVASYDGRLEAEFCNPLEGAFSSYNIEIASETDKNGNEVGYVEWDAHAWGNAKWSVYFSQTGTYEVTARMHVISAGDEQFLMGIDNQATEDIDVNIPVPTWNTTEYQTFDIGQITVGETGIHGIKLLECYDEAAAMLNAKLDYLQFTWLDPKDETVPDTDGTVIKEDAVKVYMTSTENSADQSWYAYPIEMANQLEEKDALDITSRTDDDYTTIYVYPNKTYQEFLGMGTSLEEATINNLIQLDPDVQEEILRKMIDPEQGGMTLFRLTIGTPDFTSRDFYTYYDGRELNSENAIYNETTGEYEPDWYNVTGNGFSIDKDKEYKVVETVQKVITLAQEYGIEDEIRFFASSWTPPGWMKEETDTSNSYANNDMLLKGGRLKSEHIENLAKYYTRYLEEYAKCGIDIYAMTLQNEPMLEIDYPSCYIIGEQEGLLLVALKEEIQNSEVLSETQKECQLWAYDHNPDNASAYISEVLSISGANTALDGVAFHDYYGPMSNMQDTLDALLNQGENKNQTVHLTERSVWGTAGANSIIEYFRNGASSYCSWVTMLDSNRGVHQWPGIPGPTLFVRAAGSGRDYWEIPEYYMIGQFARFIRPGYVRVDSTIGSTDTVTNVTFMDPETGKMVTVAVNDTGRKQTFRVVTGDTQFVAAIPSGNIATFIWNLENVEGMENIALNKTATASSYNTADNPPYSPEKTVDGDINTRWSSWWANGDINSTWLQVDLGKKYDLNKVVIQWETAYASNYILQVSDDGVEYEVVTPDRLLYEDLKHTWEIDASGRYIRMQTIDAATEWGTSIYEFEVYGKEWADPELEQPVELPYTDVAESDWFYNSVCWAHENSITSGTTPTLFTPDGKCTRAEIVTLLWRCAGSPEPDTDECTFDDIRFNDYYYKAVLWAVENGITYGETNTRFAPDKQCTRAEIVTFLWRGAGSRDVVLKECPFTDVQTNGYYYEAVLWAVENQITSGKTAVLFGTNEVCTRAEVVTFIYNNFE